MKRPYAIIRKVTKVGSDGLPKVAADRKAKLTLEKVWSHGRRTCRSRCGVPIEGRYYRLTRMDRRRGYNQIPMTEDYHVECVPEEAKLLLRFFGVKP
jgi:hypothetical protein